MTRPTEDELRAATVEAALQRHRAALDAAFDDLARASGVHRLAAWLTRRFTRRR